MASAGSAEAKYGVSVVLQPKWCAAFDVKVTEPCTAGALKVAVQVERSGAPRKAPAPPHVPVTVWPAAVTAPEVAGRVNANWVPLGKKPLRTM